MSVINFNGIASGLDTGSIIDKLVALEKLPQQRLQQQQNNIQKKISTLGDLISKLQNVKQKADGLNTANSTTLFSASSSDETRLKATASATAAPGSYSLRVDALARAETSRSTTFASDTAGVAGTGSLTLDINGTSNTINYDGTDSLTSIATKINASGANASASVLFDGSSYRLMVVGKQTGTSQSINFTESGSGLGMTEVFSAQNAQVSINGTLISRANNTFDDAIAGVSIQLRSTTPVGGAETSLTIDKDVQGIKTKVQGLVDSYNEVAKFLNGQLSFTGQTKGTDTLFGDSTVQGLQRQLGAMVSSSYPNGAGTASLRDIGIKLESTGTLTLDSTKFEAALTKDPGLVNNLFTGDKTTSLSAALSNLSTSFSKATTGILATKTTALQSRVTDIKKQMARFDTRADSLETRLRQQFSAMEETISSLQSQSSFLSSLL